MIPKKRMATKPRTHCTFDRTRGMRSTGVANGRDPTAERCWNMVFRTEKLTILPPLLFGIVLGNVGGRGAPYFVTWFCLRGLRAVKFTL